MRRSTRAVAAGLFAAATLVSSASDSGATEHNEKSCEEAGGTWTNQNGTKSCTFTETGKNDNFSCSETTSGQGNLGNRTSSSGETESNTGSGKCPPGQYS